MLDDHPDLSPCKCHRKAIWYRVVLWPVKDANGQVEVMRVDDFIEDLCALCFYERVPVEERDGWICTKNSSDG